MNLKKIYNVYDTIKKRLPKTYPRPQLAFYEDEACMLKNNKMRPEKDLSVYAIYNPTTSTISLPLLMMEKYINDDGETKSNKRLISSFSETTIAHTILHEIGHAYAGERYGYDSDQYTDEQYCDRFAERWIKVLKQEKLLNKE